MPKFLHLHTLDGFPVAVDPETIKAYCWDSETGKVVLVVGEKALLIKVQESLFEMDQMFNLGEMDK